MKMPVIFLGHGSPMNAIADNDVTKTFAKLGTSIPKPKVILMISAHWMTDHLSLTHNAHPKTIHDFGGFPKELYSIQYPAPGLPKFAEEMQAQFKDLNITLDEQRGLDHGTWSVLKHVYPKADIPVVQLSLNMKETYEYHFDIGKKLRPLREQNVLIMGSGNMVHNLRTIEWDEDAKALPWASKYDQWLKEKINARDFQSLISHARDSEEGKLSIPTPDHYFPLLYILGASEKEDSIEYIFEGMQNASISMRSVLFG